MKRAAAFLVLTSLLSPGVNAASPSPLSLETLSQKVCGQTARAQCLAEVERWDQKLNAAWQIAIKLTTDAPGLRDQQRRWLVEVRDACAGVNCLKESTAARIVQFQAIEVAHYGRLHKPMDADEQMQICEGVASLGSTGELDLLLMAPADMPQAKDHWSALDAFRLRHEIQGDTDGVFKLPLRQHQELLFASFFTGGSCSSYEVFPLDKPTLGAGETWPASGPVDDEAETLLWARSGGGDSVLEFRGRYFLATGSFRTQALSWLTPGGTIRALCSFQSNATRKVPSRKFRQEKLCGDIVSGKVEPDTAFKEMGSDLDNDGEPDDIELKEESDGAGCGHEFRWFQALPGSKTAEQLAPLNKILGEVSNSSFGVPGVYRVAGVTYVESNSQGEPSRVHRIQGGKVSQVCEFRVIDKLQVEKIFPLTD